MWIEYKAILCECEGIFLKSVGSCRVLINAPTKVQVKEEKEENSCIEISTDSDTTTTAATIDEIMNESHSTPSIENLNVTFPQLPSEHVEELKDKYELENFTERAPTKRRGRSLSRLGNQLQDINGNFASKGGRRSRRETSVSSKFAEYEINKVQSKHTTPRINKRKHSRARSMPSNKKSRKTNEIISDAELMAQYGIKPCFISIEPLQIERPKNSQKTAVKRVRQLKVKVQAISNKNKSPKTRKGKKSRSTDFPVPFNFKEENKEGAVIFIRDLTNGMFKSAARSDSLIITEDLPSTLVISEGFCAELNDNENLPISKN